MVKLFHIFIVSIDIHGVVYYFCEIMRRSQLLIACGTGWCSVLIMHRHVTILLGGRPVQIIH